MMTFVLQDGWSPLNAASKKGHLDVVETLLEAGANINQATRYRWENITGLGCGARSQGNNSVVEDLPKQENGKALAQDEPEDVIELLDKNDDALDSYCSDPDEPVMSGSDDEFSNLEQENVDELMPTNLRSIIVALPRDHVITIGMDVARGLNYLHLMRPDPIIHRDVSSANVLLEPIGPVITMGPGNASYAAPESFNPKLQSPRWMCTVMAYSCLKWPLLTRTPHSSIFQVHAVVDTPSSTQALSHIRLCTKAVDTVQPDGLIGATSSKVGIGKGNCGPREAQLTAYHLGILYSPEVITHGTL
eukprot:Em0031g46a